MTDFRNNHYVPRWYQERFLPNDGRERKFCYLDLHPDRVTSAGRSYVRSALMRWGTKSCFLQRDLYTTRFKDWQSTDIEQHFVGAVDARGRSAVQYFTSFEHPSVNGDALRAMMVYLTVQKLRTPKGLRQLAELTRFDDRNAVLVALQTLRQMYGAVWTECVWSIADASESAVKFIISDHPVTIYNARCFPGSKQCRGHSDPDIRMTGSHTIFPLDLNKVLILTNLSWVRNSYANPLTFRPNPELFRDAMFNFQTIQTHRVLAVEEVREINLVIKERAFRYVAAAEEEWLYPERDVRESWDSLGRGYLFMPDPRSVDFTTEIMVGYGGGRSDAWDAYGRQPGDPKFRTDSADTPEWTSFHAFQGEFARVLGPRRRGRAFRFGKLDADDSPELHAYYLSQEANKPRNRSTHRGSKRRRQKR
jgi:hypothetical protein